MNKSKDEKHVQTHVEISSGAMSLDENGKPEIIPRPEDEMSPEEYREAMEGCAPPALTQAQVDDYAELIDQMRGRKGRG